MYKRQELITLLPSNNLSGAPITDFADSAAETDGESGASIIAAVMDQDSFIEFQAGFGAGFIAGLAKLGGNKMCIRDRLTPGWRTEWEIPQRKTGEGLR